MLRNNLFTLTPDTAKGVVPSHVAILELNTQYPVAQWSKFDIIQGALGDSSDCAQEGVVN